MEETSATSGSEGAPETWTEDLPSLSIVFPAHNEEAVIAATLHNAEARRDEYPGPVEMIVACNGCTDRTAAIASLYPVKLVEDERAGMSFGNNLGGRLARNDLILFWDADTELEPGGLAALAEAVRGRGEVTGGFYTLPDKVYPRSVLFFRVMNHFCRSRRQPPPGTVFVSRSVYERIGGFDESIPQGTGSDLVRRAKAAGAEFLYVETRTCRTSVRRFEKRGYLRQLLEWRRNIQYHSTDRKEQLARHDYEVIR
jgi:glycosyltransferase involved in cell wall biosynthesis